MTGPGSAAGTVPSDRAGCLALDAADPLAGLRETFHLPDGVIYLDGNSLGPLPRATAARLAEVIGGEWGQGLVGSWNTAGWIEAPHRVGDKIARLIGAGPGEVVVADSTSVNLYKAVWAAVQWQRAGDPRRDLVLCDRTSFPTDRYLLESACASLGVELRAVAVEDVEHLLDDRVAVLALNHVDYRNGRLHDLPVLTRAAHEAGALAIWDLAHSAGVLPIGLAEAGADLAVGCGYKYLNGGPGAPSFVWAHPRLVDRLDQPLQGWLGHRAPFDFAPEYLAAQGISRFQCGTPPILSLAALECGVDSVLAAEPLGGLAAIRAKSLALTGLFSGLVAGPVARHGLVSITPDAAPERGGQVALRAGGDLDPYAIVQALIARGVVGDFRAPDVLRFGFAPLYLRHVDVWDAVQVLGEVLDTGRWRRHRRAHRSVVT